MKIELSDFCDTTATVITPFNTFYVQTVDAEYRPDLGCWITIPGCGEDIDNDDYPEIDEVIKAAEKFMEARLPDDLIRNPAYITKQSSAYQRRFITEEKEL